jgi:hypothetical protein
MKSKFKVYLTDQIYAVLKLDLEIPNDQKALAEALGIGKEEQANLVGQEMQSILLLLGNSDEA